MLLVDLRKWTFVSIFIDASADIKQVLACSDIRTNAVGYVQRDA